MEKFKTFVYVYDEQELKAGITDSITIDSYHFDIELKDALSWHMLQIWNCKYFTGSKATTKRTKNTINTLVKGPEGITLEIHTNIIK